MLAQQITYLKEPYDTLDKVLERIGELGATRYAGIVHDKDKGEEDHIQVFMCFPNGHFVNALGKKLNIAPQYIKIWDEGINNGFAYLSHRTKDSQDDYQYSPTEVTANFNYIEFLEKYETRHRKVDKNSSQRSEVDILLDLLYIGGITREEVEQRLSGSQYAKYHKKIEDVWAKRIQILAEERMEQRKAAGEKVKVIWIYGEAGTGKTRFAKEQAAKQEETYFITGSSRDPFQRYNGEDVIIYDEARPRDMAFSDLLKLLDPYGEDVSAPSRYFDKAICASTYYITSPYSPIDFYCKIMGEDWKVRTDGFDQLLRRLFMVIKMTQKFIQAVKFDPDKKTFVPVRGGRRKNPYYTREKSQSENAAAKFKALFEDAHIESEE